MSAKEEILKRALERKNRITVNQVDAKSELNNSFTKFLSPLDSWELLAKISNEMYFLQTGIKPDNRVDKAVVNIVQKGII